MFLGPGFLRWLREVEEEEDYGGGEAEEEEEYGVLGSLRVATEEEVRQWRAFVPEVKHIRAELHATSLLG
jgi:hypothetical protein